MTKKLPIKIFDTKSKKIKSLKYNQFYNKKFYFYCCGPTVYGPSHIGNFRTFIIQDILYRLLKVLNVPIKYVRNITDIDDKSIKISNKKKQSLSTFSKKWIKIFKINCNELNILKPNYQPVSTEYIPHQIDLIQRLLKNGFGYQNHDKSVYFNIKSFKKYGELSNRSVIFNAKNNKNIHSIKNQKNKEKKLSDFVLWKSYNKKRDKNNYWKSPWGKGRPGWHTECSAICNSIFKNTIDLHSGGSDLIFPHHENEIAQIEILTKKTFSRRWLHIAPLLIDKKKMSRSKKKIITISYLKKKGFSPELIRYFLLSQTHYRKTINFNLKKLNIIQKSFKKLKKYIKSILNKKIKKEEFNKFLKIQNFNSKNLKFFKNVFKCFLKDLNFPMAIGKLFKSLLALRNQIKRKKNYFSKKKKEIILKELCLIVYILGIEKILFTNKKLLKIPKEILNLADLRWKNKKCKKFYKSDLIRRKILLKGWNIIDKKNSYIIKNKESY
jgi:cysteinyl-tRNA synthetase